MANTTTRAFTRSSGRSPRGYGSWGFQRSTTEAAYDGDLYGEMEFFQGTLTEARREAKRTMTNATWLALLP